MGQIITMNWIDWTALAIVLVSILRGTRYGVLAGALDLLALVASFLAASALYTRAIPPLRQSLFLPASWAGFVGFVAIWLILYILAGTIIRLIHGARKAPVSQALGGVVGGIRGVTLATALLVLMLAAPFGEAVAPDVYHSLAAAYLLRGYHAMMARIPSTMPVRIPRIGPGGTQF